MNEPVSTLADRLEQRFGARIGTPATTLGQTAIDVPAEHWLEIAHVLRDEPELAFEQLIDLCGVDYLGYGEDEWDTDDVSHEGFSRGVEGLGPGRFTWPQAPRGERPAGAPAKRYAAVVQLLSIARNQRLRVRVFASDDSLPAVPSVTDIWPAANWFEREAFDLYGIVFEGHPDLRRLLTDYGFVGHPFRKDFPLIGNVEVRYDPEKKRVVYEPVSIEPRVLVPRVVRQDSRYLQGQAEAAAKGGS
jgi:NADH-quinone oxidoreductase subunit C